MQGRSAAQDGLLLLHPHFSCYAQTHPLLLAIRTGLRLYIDKALHRLINVGMAHLDAMAHAWLVLSCATTSLLRHAILIAVVSKPEIRSAKSLVCAFPSRARLLFLVMRRGLWCALRSSL